MTMGLPTLDPAKRTELEAWEQRRLSPEELEARINAPWSDEEREDFERLVAWFNRRYPTPRERLAATRHLAAQLRSTSVR